MIFVLILYGKFDIILTFLNLLKSTLITSIFNIFILLLFLYFCFKNNTNYESFSISNICLGLFTNNISVKKPYPGPISITTLVFILVCLTIFYKYFYQL